MNKSVKRIYRSAALFLSIAMMLPSPSYAARQAATGVPTSGASAVRNELRSDLEKLGHQPSAISDQLSAISQQLSFRSEVRKNVRFGFEQKEEKTTHSFASFNVGRLLKDRLNTLPKNAVDEVRRYLQAAYDKKWLKGVEVVDLTATHINIHVTHNFGENNADVHRIMLEAVRAGLAVMKDKLKTDLLNLSATDLIAQTQVTFADHSFKERPGVSESVAVAMGVNVDISAFNNTAYDLFGSLDFNPANTLSGDKIRGFRFYIQKRDDILNGRTGPEYIKVLEHSKTGENGEPAVNQWTEIKILLAQTENVVTAVYPVRGGAFKDASEPLMTVAFQPAFGSKGEPVINPIAIFRGQSGGPPIGAIGHTVANTRYVLGAENADHYVAVRPYTLEEARRPIKAKGIGGFVMYGFEQSGNGYMPRNKYIPDYFGMSKSFLLAYIEKAKKFAKIMSSHEGFQPFLHPRAAAKRAHPTRHELNGRFINVVKDFDVDPVYKDVDAKVASGALIKISTGKADYGALLGHTKAPAIYTALQRAYLEVMKERGKIADYYTLAQDPKNKMQRVRLEGNYAVGDDTHLTVVGGKVDDVQLIIKRAMAIGPVFHMLAFKDSDQKDKPGIGTYGLFQDLQGSDGEAVKKDPFGWLGLEDEGLTERFFTLANKLIDKRDTSVVQSLQNQWQTWHQSQTREQASQELIRGSSNTSAQGIGVTYFYLDPKKDKGYAEFNADKMGPPSKNIIHTYAMKEAQKESENGLVAEIWDLKAFDENGNVAAQDLPKNWSDISYLVLSASKAKTPRISKQDTEWLEKTVYAGGVLAEAVDHARLSEILKHIGFVPAKRIFLDVATEMKQIETLLGDSDRFNVKAVWDKKQSGWNADRMAEYLDRPISMSTVSRLGLLAGGEYVGKDDDKVVGTLAYMKHMFNFVKKNPWILQGDMNGSHQLWSMLVSVKEAVATINSAPIAVGLINHFKNGKLTGVTDVFADKAFDKARKEAAEFNLAFVLAQRATNPHLAHREQVEGAYAIEAISAALDSPESPFWLHKLQQAARAKYDANKTAWIEQHPGEPYKEYVEEYAEPVSADAFSLYRAAASDQAAAFQELSRSEVRVVVTDQEVIETAIYLVREKIAEIRHEREMMRTLNSILNNLHGLVDQTSGRNVDDVDQLLPHIQIIYNKAATKLWIQRAWNELQSIPPARSELRKLKSIDPRTTPAWQRLQEADRPNLRDLLKDPLRSRYSVDASVGSSRILFDYSKHRVDEKILGALLDLAEETHVYEAIRKMFSGDKINETEQRAVLHTALRAPRGQKILVDGKDVVPEVRRVLDQMEAFSNKINSGEWTGYTGKRITDVVNIGIGGSDLGPVMATEALKAYATKNTNVHFVSNVDGTDAAEKVLKKLDPETTLVIVASKTFTTQETMTNADTVRAWFLEKAQNPEAIKKHFVAISTNQTEVEKFGIDPANMFEFWDWVGGRFSMWSAIGLSTMIYIGPDHFRKMLAGAHAMDEHFLKTRFSSNIPVLMALLNIWNTNFLGARTQAILPYDQYLHRFPAYLQQGIMESNGKSVNRKGKPVKYATSPVIWGEPGTNGQHSFFQKIHQGTEVIPADFIAFAQSLNPAGDHHNKLLANFLAQTKALALGKTRKEVAAEKVKKDILPHKVFPGNIPTTTILLDKLTPESLGALTAAYEHRIFVEGVIWNIFSFDQWGVELGKVQAGAILKDLKAGSSDAHDPSTNLLIQWILKHRSEVRSAVNVDAVKNGAASVSQLTSILTNQYGIPVVSNGFFHDGLFTSEEEMKRAFHEYGAANLTTNQSIARKKAASWKPIIQELWAQGVSPEEAFLRAYFLEGKAIHDFLAPLRDAMSPMGQVSVEGSALAKTESELTNSMHAIDALFGAGANPLVKLPNIQGALAGLASHQEDGPLATFNRAREGKNGNITLGFFTNQYIAHAVKLLEGFSAYAQYQMDNGISDDEIREQLSKLNWVFSLFMTRNDRLIVPMIDRAIQNAGNHPDQIEELKLLRGKTAVAIGRFTGQVMQHIFLDEPLRDDANFLSAEDLASIRRAKGLYEGLRDNYDVRPLNLLIASSAKYPEQTYATDLQYSLPFLGKGMWNTLPPAALKALSQFVKDSSDGLIRALQVRNLVSETLPWVLQDSPESNWDRLILETAEQRQQKGVESRSASWILKRTEELVLRQAQDGEQSFVELARKLRDQGAAGFEKDEVEMIAMIRGWYALEAIKITTPLPTSPAFDFSTARSLETAVEQIEEGIRLLITAKSGYQEKFNHAISALQGVRIKEHILTQVTNLLSSRSEVRKARGENTATLGQLGYILMGRINRTIDVEDIGSRDMDIFHTIGNELTDRNKDPQTALLTLATLLKSNTLSSILIQGMTEEEVISLLREKRLLHNSNPAVRRSEARSFVEGTSMIELSAEELKRPRAFGTNGIRGDDLYEESLRRITSGSAEVLLEQWKAEHPTDTLPWMIVGFDPRPQGVDGFVPGEMGEAKAMAETLAAYGFPVLFVPKPIAAPFMISATGVNVHPRNIYAAFMRTASHNEVLDPKSGQLVSGIKLFTQNAPAADALTKTISARINDPNRTSVPKLPFDLAVKKGLITVVQDGDENDPETVEWNRLNRVFDFAKLGAAFRAKFPELKIALNTEHGGMSKFAVRVLEALGIPFTPFNTTFMNDPANKEKMTGFVIYKDPATGETKQARFAPDPTREWMRGQDYLDYVASDPFKILSLLIDGDADRLVTEASQKEIIPNDIGLMAEYYLRVLKGQNGRVVRTTPTIGALGGGKAVVTPVGSKWFAGPNQYFDGTLNDVLVAVEESGHIVFRYKDELFFDHSIGLALLMLEMMAETGKTWTEFLDDTWAHITKETGIPRIAAVRTGIAKDEGAPQYYGLVARLGNPNEAAFRVQFAQEFEKELAAANIPWKVTGFDITDAGGAQFQFDGYRRLMPRKSGTDGSVRMYIEVQESERNKVPALVSVMRKVMDSFLSAPSSAARSEARSAVSVQSFSNIGRRSAMIPATPYMISYDPGSRDVVITSTIPLPITVSPKEIAQVGQYVRIQFGAGTSQLSFSLKQLGAPGLALTITPLSENQVTAAWYISPRRSEARMQQEGLSSPDGGVHLPVRGSFGRRSQGTLAIQGSKTDALTNQAQAAAPQTGGNLEINPKPETRERARARSETRVQLTFSHLRDERKSLFEGLRFSKNPKTREAIQRSVIAPVASQTGNGSIFSADFAFGAQGGLQLIPYLTAGGPAVVVLDQDHQKAAAQREVVQQFNQTLKFSGFREIAIARNGFEAVDAINAQLADIERATGKTLSKTAFVVDSTQPLVKELKAAKLREIIPVTGVQFQRMMTHADIAPSQTEFFVQHLEALGAISASA